MVWNTHSKFLAVCFFFLLFTNATSASEKKVLLVGIDGMQLEHIAKLATPAFDRLHIYPAYAGGVKGLRSQQKTISGPGWTTIMTGVWQNKHGVATNVAGPSNVNWPSIFRYIYNADNHAEIYSYSTWGPINSRFFPHDMSILQDHAEGGSDDDNLNRTLNVLQNANPNFIFVHLDEPDSAGHSHGFGEEYDQSIIRSDQRLGRLLDEVETRRQQWNEDWLVLVVTDHGREANGRGHGNQTHNEKIIFIASNQPLNTEYKKFASVANDDFKGIYHYPAQTYITPTILQFMEIWTSNHLLLDGLPLVGDLHTQKIYTTIFGRKCGLEWDSNWGTPLTLNWSEHVAKFDCDTHADPFIITNDKIYANIYGSGCGFQWDTDSGTPLTLDSNEHIAKFDCTGDSDQILIENNQMTSNISGKICGLQWDADAGTPSTLNNSEHVAKFDCEGSADPIVIE